MLSIGRFDTRFRKSRRLWRLHISSGGLARRHRLWVQPEEFQAVSFWMAKKVFKDYLSVNFVIFLYGRFTLESDAMLNNGLFSMFVPTLSKCELFGVTTVLTALVLSSLLRNHCEWSSYT